VVDENEPTGDVTAVRRRSRRAASRPAGPPPHAELDVAAGESEAEVGAVEVGAESEVEPESEVGADGAGAEALEVKPEAVEVGADEPEVEPEVAVEDATASEPAATAEPAAPSQRRPRRATRGVTTVAFSAEPAPELPAPPAVAEVPALALFQPPDETKAVRKRRTRSSSAEGAGRTGPSGSGPTEESGDADARDADSRDVADVAADAEPADVEPADVIGATQVADALDGTEGEAGEAPESRADSGESDQESGDGGPRRRRRRGGRRRRRPGPGGPDQAEDLDEEATEESEDDEAAPEPIESGEGDEESASSRRRRRRRRKAGVAEEMEDLSSEDPANTVVKVREGRSRSSDEITSVRGSTRIEAKKQRRRDGRDAGRRRAPILTEAEFLARRESVNRVMCVREHGDRTQIAVLEDGILVEHYVNRAESSSMVGNVYLGKVQNVLPSMEAAFVDIGRGRNAVLYAGEVNWDAAGLEGQPKRIELALKSGDPVLVQVTKDPIGHKGARLTSQISLPGRFLVYVPEGSMTGISRKLPDTERARLKGILRDVVPDGAGVIVRTAAEGATEEQLTSDVQRLTAQWASIQKRAKSQSPPSLLYGEPDLAIKVVRDIFNEDFTTLLVQGEDTWQTLNEYIGRVAPDLTGKLERWIEPTDLYAAHRIDEQLAKALDRKVWLPSGGSLVIDRTEAMTVIDVNTGKFTGQGGNLEETVTRNNLEAAEEIVRQLRLRDIGGIIVVDFIDMVLQSNRDLVLRRLVECLGRDRTKHQVAEVTSLGLVQMTRKRIGQGLLEVFSTSCEACGGRGHLVSTEPVDDDEHAEDRGRRGNGERGARRSRKPAPVNLGGKQTGKTPPPPKFDEHGHLEHAEEAEHADEHADDAEHADEHADEHAPADVEVEAVVDAGVEVGAHVDVEVEAAPVPDVGEDAPDAPDAPDGPAENVGDAPSDGEPEAAAQAPDHSEAV